MNALARRLPAITALTVAAIISIIAAGLLVRLVEARSLSDVTAGPAAVGLRLGPGPVDGLQVRLTGTAPTEAMRFRALSAAGTVVDPTRVIDDIAVIEKVCRRRGSRSRSCATRMRSR